MGPWLSASAFPRGCHQPQPTHSAGCLNKQSRRRDDFSKEDRYSRAQGTLRQKKPEGAEPCALGAEWMVREGVPVFLTGGMQVGVRKKEASRRSCVYGPESVVWTPSEQCLQEMVGLLFLIF